MNSSLEPLRQSRDWVERFVVELDVCPFARRELERDSIRYVPVDATDVEHLLLILFEECRHLDASPGTETTLLVLIAGAEDFEHYLDCLDLGEALLEQQGYEGVYQLASFHPDYVFDGAEADDPANYTNRAPWPMLHLLREASIERALAHFPRPERIPERNVAVMRKLGIEALTARLDDLKRS
ncbi:DUF1415 domain-containing protein [Halomonas sp. McH1-25]|uniref:DUF1415 domain-containing protein n=1 Tax=unclassified Halomonas TaxID=2609666 RepID=UPI001EF663E6|nr:MULTISPECIES: DUF1415 domain-containing protein [unclassified Halomonas]MCG7601059.1 DUF1415 domain-containing protein [Halomonas sp. McH1-25]MCP1343848.1 DUF1415 domain-containing protein [Halomonas sp. FL8]MCP1361223.1 DUF1415 domain-containing protein [Halomonas sp. BBD45]MCP1366549.1 DUF1415 domain-containing protein [Halomonas sp. BBD48]